jgi:sensor histidine kinase YesM
MSDFDLPSKQRNTQGQILYYTLPLLLGTILYSIYVISSQFMEAERFSIPFLLMNISCFYVYLFASIKSDEIVARIGVIKPLWLKSVLPTALALIVSLLISLILYVLLKQFYISILSQNDTLNLYHLTVQSLSILVGFTLMHSIYYTFKTYRNNLENELKIEQINHAQTALKLEQLSSKLDPHFLFNNLNTLHSILPSTASDAQRFTINLSKILRYSLAVENDELVSVDKEMMYLNEYVSLLKVRFGDVITVHSTIELSNQYSIFPMTLLHLMENAIKHNVISEVQPLKISINFCDGYLDFTNNRYPAERHETIGGSLNTLKELYRLKIGSPIKTQMSELTFTVSIPLIKQI